ncbi:MAG: hypothetical protein JXA21_26155 [Anaerolineae bacterium]|nr:hypothetical protein [Anaerolineae bacterium]
MTNVLLLVVVTGGSLALPAPARGQTAYDCSTATGLPQSECEALVALYNATGGDSWYNHTGWLQTTTPCTWYGVTCTDGHVTRLVLSGNDMSGALPPEIGNLTALEELSLDLNALTALPAEIGNLTMLKRLDLSSGNALTTLPAAIGNLTALEYLDLDYTNLVTLPAEIGDLPVLEWLKLGRNHLSVLPPAIGGLTTLTYLDLESNDLTALPAEIGNLTALKHLYLDSNKLTSLPSEIGNLTALMTLRLDDNELTSLPPAIGNLTALTVFWLDDNELTSLPPAIGNLTAMEELSLGGNHLTALPSWIGNLTALIFLRADRNALAELPSWIGNLTALNWLDLDQNALTALPQEVGNLSSLKGLYLSANAFTTLPEEIDTFTNLIELRMAHNALTSVPPEIANFFRLRYLDLSHNPLIALPPEFVNLVALEGLNLDHTLLSGEIPAFLTSLHLKEFTFSETAWCVPSTGPVPRWLGVIQHVEGSGLVCGPAMGSLKGAVTLPGGAPAAGVQVNLYGNVSNMSWWHHFTTTYTLADGAYRFDNLGPNINYYLQFVVSDVHYISEYYSNAPSLEQATPVTVTLGSTRAGIDAELAPSAAQIIKYSAPGYYVADDSLLTYTLVVSANVDTELTIYDPLGDHLTWQGFVGTAPGTLTYTTALTGSVAVSAAKPLLVSFAVRVNVPDTSFVSQFAQVSNTAYYDFLGVTYPSNTYVNVVYRGTIPTIYLPLVIRGM